MRSLFTILFLFLSFIFHVNSQIFIEEIEALDDDDPLVSGFVPPSGPRTNLSIVLETTFPESQNPKLGMFYNGRTSRVDVAISNGEKEPIKIHFIGGQFQDVATLKPVFNITAKPYNTHLLPGKEEVFPYSVQSYFPGPRVLHLSIAVQFTLDGQTYQSLAHNGTITIADPPQSIFDPQAWFLYLILASVIGGAGYLVYSTWIKAILPGKVRANRNVTKRERPVAKSDTAQNYEEWIPQHHLKKDAGSVKKRKGGRAVSPSSGSN